MRFTVLFYLAGSLMAQETIHFASASGRVVDQTEGSIAGARVSARQVETDVSVSTTTDAEGRFRFPYLPVGSYEISARVDKFADVRQSVKLSVGGGAELTLRMGLASTGASVEVREDVASIDTARSQIAGTVTQEEVDGLPLNGRNFLDLALLIPGVSPTNTASTQLFAETSAVPGQGISVGSQRNFSNSFIVDGFSANDDAAGLTGTFYGMNVVREFQVVTSGGQAEFGRALGGYISMVTRSGANKLHGDVYGFFRNQRFNAANALSHNNLPLTQAQYGASLGGPIVKGRTFYFGNFEKRALNQSGLITIAPANVAAINARLAASGYQGPMIATGQYPNPVHTTNFLAKVDHRFGERDQFSARYSLYDVNSSNSRGVGALSAVSAAAGLADRDQTIAVSNVWTLTPRTVNETRGQFTNSNLAALPNDLIGPAVSVAGVATLGRLSGSPVGRLDKLVEVADNLSHQAGAHTWRTGVDFLYNDLTITFPQSIRGSYSFSSLANFTRGAYNNAGFTQSFGNPVVPQTNPNVGFYAQDEWALGPHFRLNAGVRYDLQFLRTINTDGNNVSPRLGFAWSPGSSKRTVVRGSFGLFYDRVPLRALANALLSSGNSTALTNSTFVTVSLSPTQTGAPVFPNILSALPGGVLVNYTTMDRNMQNAYSEQGSLEIERQLSEKSTLSVSYQHMRGIHLIISVNQNAPTCIAAGNNNGCRPNAGFGNNRQYSPLADSHYDGLHVSFLQRPVKWGDFRVSYSYSKALDNVGEFFFSSPIDNFNIWQDYARSDDDQRQRVVFEGNAHTPMRAGSNAWQKLSHGFQLSTVLQYYSALPFNATTGSTTIQGTTARPLVNGAYIGRNAGTGFDSFTINTRLSRTFALREPVRLQAIAEGFNTLNHRNSLIPNGTFGSGAYPSSPLASFGQPTAVGDPRTLQFALRLTF